MFANLDFDHPEVVKEMEKWGVWVSRELDLDGMRLDAIKHINDEFIKKFLAAVRKERGEDFYAVGEYWKQDLDSLDEYLKEERYKVDLFDVPLHYNMYQASEHGRDYDLTKILDGTLVQNHPTLAVTFVDNHDSQWGSSLQSAVKDWFKPSAYALIPLMKTATLPLLRGLLRRQPQSAVHRGIIDNLLEIRKNHAYGEQNYYFDHPNTIGFTRVGDEQHRIRRGRTHLQRGKRGQCHERGQTARGRNLEGSHRKRGGNRHHRRRRQRSVHRPRRQRGRLDSGERSPGPQTGRPEGRCPRKKADPFAAGG